MRKYFNQLNFLRVKSRYWFLVRLKVIDYKVNIFYYIIFYIKPLILSHQIIILISHCKKSLKYRKIKLLLKLLYFQILVK